MTGTLDPHIRRYLLEGRRTGRMNTLTARQVGYRLHRFSQFFGARPLEHLSRRGVTRWMESLDGLAPGTRHNHVSAVHGLCVWLCEHGEIRVDPFVGIRPVRQPRRLPRALPAESVVDALACCPDLRTRAIVQLMVGCGLRCVEVSRLEAGDYDALRRTLRVVGKGRHERLLPVPTETAWALDAYLAAEGARHGPLIRSRLARGSGIGATYIGRLACDTLVEAGVKRRPGDGISAHSLRHTAATDVLEHSGDIRAVQQMLGHANLATTSVYLGMAHLGTLRSAMEGRSYRVALSEDGA